MNHTEPVIRRRTPGERVAYLQGHLAALRSCVNAEGLPAKLRRRLVSEIAFHESSLAQALKEADQ